MHARWDFDASSARTQSALDKHQKLKRKCIILSKILEHKVNTQLLI